MPDWFFFKDKAGNGYYYDRAFKIRITEEKQFSYEPVSADGIDFYFNTGVDLVKAGRMTEGLFYLKSIRLLRSGNSRINRVRSDSTGWINALYKKHGDRFEEADRESTLLISVNNGVYELVNDKLFYRINFSSRPFVIKNGWKDRYRGYGLKLGINKGRPGETEGYDYVIGIETRVFTNALDSLEEAESVLYGELVYDSLKREKIVRQDDRAVYYYEYQNSAPFCGIEGIFYNGKIVHMVRGICHTAIKDRVIDEMKRNIMGLILVK
ncbi:MAG TPA: hypothetical protein PK514_13750 [Spirochaetota bacterium]|nr:hypothetical protein [Spirochaetota bacterium]